MPKPEEVPNKPKKKQSCGGLGLGGLKNFGFFGTSSGFGKVFKKNQNLRRYQKNQSLEVKILPKPEEVPKNKKIIYFEHPHPRDVIAREM